MPWYDIIAIPWKRPEGVIEESWSIALPEKKLDIF